VKRALLFCVVESTRSRRSWHVRFAPIASECWSLQAVQRDQGRRLPIWHATMNVGVAIINRDPCKVQTDNLAEAVRREAG
jgi:hypothetical protein